MDVKSIILQILRQVYYFGYSRQCNICGFICRSFKMHGHNSPILKKLHVIGGERIKGKCVSCNRTERERLLYWFLFSSNQFQHRGKNILHIAPESSIASKFNELKKNEKLHYITGDKFTEGYSYDFCEELDITATPYKDNSFDLIICNHVLEHIIDDNIAMCEIFRILKPTGKAILQVPISKILDKTLEDTSLNNPEDRELKFGQFDHVRIYEQNDYVNRLKNNGFEVLVLNSQNLISKENIIRWGINPAEDIYCCLKH